MKLASGQFYQSQRKIILQHMQVVVVFQCPYCLSLASDTRWYWVQARSTIIQRLGVETIDAILAVDAVLLVVPKQE